jgi:MAGE family
VIAAEKSENQTTNSNSWVLVSTLPQKYRDPSIIPPPNIPTSTEEANYVGLYTFVVSLIYLNQERLPENKLERHLNQLNLEQNSPVGPTDKLFKRMEKEGYIVKCKDNSTGEEMVEYLVGPRGKVEVDKQAASKFIEMVWGSAAAEEGFKKKLEKSLGVSLPQSVPLVDGVGGPSAPQGRRRRETTAATE